MKLPWLLFSSLMLVQSVQAHNSRPPVDDCFKLLTVHEPAFALPSEVKEEILAAEFEETRKRLEKLGIDLPDPASTQNLSSETNARSWLKPSNLDPNGLLEFVWESIPNKSFYKEPLFEKEIAEALTRRRIQSEKAVREIEVHSLQNSLTLMLGHLQKAARTLNRPDQRTEHIQSLEAAKLVVWALNFSISYYDLSAQGTSPEMDYQTVRKKFPGSLGRVDTDGIITLPKAPENADALRVLESAIAIEELAHVAQIVHYRLHPESKGFISKAMLGSGAIRDEVRNAAYASYISLDQYPPTFNVYADLEREADFYAFFIESAGRTIQINDENFNGYPSRAVIEKNKEIDQLND